MEKSLFLFFLIGIILIILTIQPCKTQSNNIQHFSIGSAIAKIIKPLKVWEFPFDAATGYIEFKYIPDGRILLNIKINDDKITLDNYKNDNITIINPFLVKNKFTGENGKFFLNNNQYINFRPIIIKIHLYINRFDVEFLNIIYNNNSKILKNNTVVKMDFPFYSNNIDVDQINFSRKQYFTETTKSPAPIKETIAPIKGITASILPAFITLELEGVQKQENIKLKFKSKSNSSDISWNISNQEFIIAPNSYIYIGGSNTPSIPAAKKLIDYQINNLYEYMLPRTQQQMNQSLIIKYELRDDRGNILPSSGAGEFVSIFIVDNNYVIRPNLSGNDFFNRTGMVGYWKFTIMAL